MALDTGEDAYVHMEFYLQDSEEYPTWVKDEIPDEFGLYANATDQIS
ncbi:hypothetical protein HSR121_1814 [Halapricum desulfuricans]|uniref:Uncharacterized protein n=2 Tax=Halapricum desulfuricans TaxID=2841257 RepID=A0A897N1Q8_9EURY|nr:hypothetical protein HSR121_1814 [Halapricum desulfuricans]